MRALLALLLVAACCGTDEPARASQPALTIYNQDFAVVRQTVPLNLEPGLNRLEFTETTAHLEPDSVILRDPTGQHHLQVLEQNFRADPISQALLLSLHEGQTIDFVVPGKDQPVPGRIVRSAYVPHYAAWQRYGQAYRYRQSAAIHPGGGAGQPIIEMDGKLRFGLPGVPLFPSLGDVTVLVPTLHWVLQTDAAGHLDTELSYITGGMSWKADYNVVAPPEEDVLELVAWVTMDNQSGRTFEEARIKLMAGEVSKLRPRWSHEEQYLGWPIDRRAGISSFEQAVVERAFDDYHLYTLTRATTLRDHQTKQVEFTRASDIRFRRLYVYNGARINWERYRGWNLISLRQDRDLGTRSSSQVSVMREFANTKDNNLGIPLPGGRIRFYQRDQDGQLEFLGENDIAHTPRDEIIRVYTGNAFDLVGERRRTDFRIDHNAGEIDEAFRISLRNHKDDPAQILVVEELYRWYTWEITERSHEFSKRDSQAIEFEVEVPPGGQEIVTYKVRYSW